LKAHTSTKILSTGHYSAFGGGAPKTLILGRYVVSFHFYFTLLGSHILVSCFLDSSKTPCERTIPKNWAPENSLQIRKIIIPAKFDLLHFQVSLQFDICIKSIKSQCGPPDFGYLFDNLQRGYLMVRVYVVELSNCC
jgi:hypothetical protein